jgi:hypothetical protein
MANPPHHTHSSTSLPWKCLQVGGKAASSPQALDAMFITFVLPGGFPSWGDTGRGLLCVCVWVQALAHLMTVADYSP